MSYEVSQSFAVTLYRRSTSKQIQSANRIYDNASKNRYPIMSSGFLIVTIIKEINNDYNAFLVCCDCSSSSSR